MLRKTVIALLAVASIGLVSPTMALARGGGGGGHGGGMGGGGLAAVAVSMVVAASEEVVSMAAAWLADSITAVVSTEVDLVVANFTAVDFMVATSGAASHSARA